MKRRSIAIGIVLLLLAGGGAWWLAHRKTGAPLAVNAVAQKHATGASPISVPTEALNASVVVHVTDPSAVRHVAESSQWLRDALRSPLGQGFLGPWAGFFGSRGEDLQASFKGTVLDFLLDELTARPAQLVWFGGDSAPGVPVLIVDTPSSGAREAIAMLAKTSEYGTATATHCPGETEPEIKKDKDGKDIPAPARFTFSRLLIADQALFAFADGKRLVLSPKPLGALAGVCGKFTDVGQGALSIVLDPATFGREAQQLAALLGLSDAPTLVFAVKGDQLVPQGIVGALEHTRLQVQPLSDEALKVIPEAVPVALSLALNLPSELTTESLQAFLKGGASSLTPRQVTLLWQPNAKAASEVGIVWSRPQDEQALRTIFAGPNALRRETMCGQHVLASSAKLLAQMRDACAGKLPSLTSAAPAVVSGLREAESVTLLVNLGHLTSALLRSAYDGASVPEMNAAFDQLEQLPAFGFAGAAQGATLAPKGFRS